MPKRFLSALTIWMLFTGCFFAVSDTFVPAQDLIAQALPAVADIAPATPENPPAPTVDRQMLTFDRHARVDMILYTGRFDRGDLAATMKQVDAIALSVKAAR